MDIDTENPVPQSYTILRIKRKRHEGPLDALAVESRVRRKKSRGGIGVFRFAQTVEHDAWQDEQRQRDLQDQISRLARETASKAETHTVDAAVPLTSSPSNPCAQQDDLNRRYTIIKQDVPELGTCRLPTSPSKVIVSQGNLPINTSPDFKMYDAVLSAEKPKITELDSEMDKFMPMLKDYLKLQDMSPDSSPSKVPVLTAGQLNSIPPSTSHASDYVWDIFYHRPATLSEWNEAASVGTLAGLPPSITDSYDSPSDSEEEDGWDEDSNAEEYYKNDYPDEEEPSSDDGDGSDVFHEHSDQSDPVCYADDEDEHDWR